MLVVRDEALERFDKLCVLQIAAEYYDSVERFLAEFQTAVASLEPDVRIKLEVAYVHENSMELLKAVLADPHASKICSLRWRYSEEEEDVNSIVPLLLSTCPELASLEVDFEYHSAFDFVSSVIEHPSNKIKVLVLPQYTRGNIPRFFAALGQSQVSALTIRGCDSLEFYQGSCEYLARDLLVRLQLWGYESSEMMMSLTTCTRLAKLEMSQCTFTEPIAFTHLPKSISILELNNCTFVDGFDWSFLGNGSGMRELDLGSLEDVDGNQLGSALAVHLRAKGLDKLRIGTCDFDNEVLAAVGLEIGRIKRLNIGNANDASIELISLALESPNNAMKELSLPYNLHTVGSIVDSLLPALKHSNCNLIKLGFLAKSGYSAAARRVNDMFYKRLALFVLLQGQQVRRLRSPLRRLPVDLLRLVGTVLV